MSDLHPSASFPDAARMTAAFLPDALLNAFAAVRHLHRKQIALLSYLNSRRDPATPHQTVPLSYSHLHHATGITIEHIRRNGLHRLFACGLLSVVLQGLGGTIYRLHYDVAVLNQVIEKVGTPLVGAAVAALHAGHLHDELAGLEQRLAMVKQLQEYRKAVQREEFEAHLSKEDRQWFTMEAKRRIDIKEGIRFIRDRFPLYEAERMRLIDEWIARQAYGQSLPTSLPFKTEESPFTSNPSVSDPIINQ